jgi:hypothetical protein
MPYSENTKWRLYSYHGHEKTACLHLYPELDCSACVGEIDGSGRVLTGSPALIEGERQ